MTVFRCRQATEQLVHGAGRFCICLTRTTRRFLMGGAGLLAVLCGTNAIAQLEQTALKPVGSQSSARETPASPDWSRLSREEQAALMPLQSLWNSIGVDRQKKWLEISRNYARMSPAQQQTLHERMNQWAQLSPTQRNQARLNFAETQQATKALSAEEKKAKWEAYQALSPEEKQRLAESKPLARTTAPNIKPTPQQKLTSLPQGHTVTSPIGASGGVAHVPKIATGPHQVQNHTLLPQNRETESKSN